MSTLYIVATPIGNLEDLTFRALRILQEVDAVFCEDTRVTGKLLFAHDVKKPLRALHEHSSERAYAEAVALLRSGKNIAYASDAGTPGISDPGGKLVAAVAGLRDPDISIVPIPGPSALSAAVSVAGIPTNRFLFLGYPPHKKGRKTFFEDIAASEHPVVFYESSHRIVRSLRELHGAWSIKHGTSPDVIVCRELTKKFETTYRGTAESVLPEIEKNQRGEFVIIVQKEKTRQRA